MQMTMDAQYLSSRLVCGHEDKLGCLDTIKQLCHLHVLVSRQGLLALGDVVDVLEDPFIKASVMAAIKHTENLDNILYQYLMAGNYWGKDFLKNLLITQGVPMICVGITSDKLLEHLQSWFGAEFAPIYEREMEQFRAASTESQKREQSVFLAFDQLLDLSDSHFATLCDALILEEEIDLQDLAVALKGGSDFIFRKFFCGLNEYGQCVLQTQMQLMNHIRRIDVECAQGKIIRKAKSICCEERKNEKE